MKYVLSLVLNAHLPFVREYSKDNLAPGSTEENWFFDALSETYLPLLEVFERLEQDNIPFSLGIAFSPLLGQMLRDDLLLKKYAVNLEHQIEFGNRETERLRSKPEMAGIARYYLDRAGEKKARFERYGGNIFKAFNHFRQKGTIEYLATPATGAFLPLFTQFPESVQAQLEVAQSFYRYEMCSAPGGIWLPDLGWSIELDTAITAFGYDYTITDSHGFVFGNPEPSRGSFYPVKTPHNLSILGRDFFACSEIQNLKKNKQFRDNSRDISFELPAEEIGNFLTKYGARCYTGFKYWQNRLENTLYNPEIAISLAKNSAEEYFTKCCGRLETVSGCMNEIPISVIALDADDFGRHWYEGPYFLETIFRLAAQTGTACFMTPSEYLGKQEKSAFEVSVPAYSSWGENGYAESWLDSKNDWIYRHLFHAAGRMVELAERFSEDSGLKERALNQAARELLLAQSSDWPKMLKRQQHSYFANNQIENALRNFTTIYEALGSSHISTEWLTSLEKHHNFFPAINYRVFRRKQ